MKYFSTRVKTRITACCVFNQLIHKTTKNTNLAGYTAIFNQQGSSYVLLDNTTGWGIMHFHWKSAKKFLQCRKYKCKIYANTWVPTATYLQDHGGWDQQSLDHPPTRRAKVPAGPAADCAATRLAHPPSGSGWSCTGWGPLPSLGTALARKWDPARRTSSIWSPSDQPGTQKKGEGGKRSLGVQSCCAV